MKTKPDDYVTGTTPGKRLTKREYFAAMAMQGYLSSHPFNASMLYVVIQSVKFADALIEALNAEQTKPDNS